MRLMQPEINRLGEAMFDNANQNRPRRPKEEKCPKCGAPGLFILYGMPDGQEPPEGCVWGGCVIGEDEPDYACPECGHTWVRAAP
jgi:predicted RNA-binding Zn-ribbon protein involved in translation (DUF1610 family)